jgi:hypothetical protein
MNWKLIFQLSLFGLAMGIATVYVIPSKIEPAFWLVIFVISAYAIAKGTVGARFVHGVVLGLGNCVWITGAPILLFDRYIATHAQEAAMMNSMPAQTSPKLMMAIVGPVIGLVSGAIIGLFAVIAGKLIKPRGIASSTPA